MHNLSEADIKRLTKRGVSEVIVEAELVAALKNG